MKTAVTTLSLLALAGVASACSGPAATPMAANNTTAEIATNDVGIAPPLPAGNAVDAAPDLANASDVADGDYLATFPVVFQGRWGMNAADCDPARSDNKGLITISVDQIKFYESVARPVELTMSGKKLMADLSLTGEGQSWKSRTVFELVGGGRKLVRTEESPTASYAYTKCDS